MLMNYDIWILEDMMVSEADVLHTPVGYILPYFWQCLLLNYQYIDPRVADYFMMSSPWSSLIICVLYVVAVEWALPRFMHERKPLEFRSVIVVYNFAMVLLSGYIFVEVCNQQFLN